MLKKISVAVLSFGLMFSQIGAVSAQNSVIWIRSYPQQVISHCISYVAEWSDGTFSQTPWQCDPGFRSTIIYKLPDGTVEKTIEASPGYSQMASNGCIEYVTAWSDGTYTLVPFSCPPGVVYVKPAQSLAPLDVIDTSAPQASITGVTGARPGDVAMVTAKTHAGVVCAISFRAPDGSEPAASQLTPKRSDSDGKVTWSWTIPAGTPGGVGKVVVECESVTATADLPIL
jgi:hypothetical protein